MLVTTAGHYDKSAIMKEAHRLRRVALAPLAWSDALKAAWARAREQRMQRLTEAASFASLMGGRAAPALYTN